MGWLGDLALWLMGLAVLFALAGLFFFRDDD
jgi:hypothetical protein